MSVLRAIEIITPEIAADILGASLRSPAPNDSSIEAAAAYVQSSVPDVPAFADDIFIMNGNVVVGHDLLSAICYGGKDVTAWVKRENSFEPSQ